MGKITKIFISTTTILMMVFLPFAAITPEITEAASVAPYPYQGDPSCNDLGLGYQSDFKVDPPNNGTYTVDSVGTVTITNTNVGEFDWTSTLGIDAVIAKGGPTANFYVYDPPTEWFGDAGLVTPTNYNNNEPYDLSHVSFCYDTECGDGQCNGQETCETCPEDCGECLVTIKAYKVVCESEEDLPEWGNGGPDITTSTAADYVAQHPNCHFESNWYFQWGQQDSGDPGRDFYGEAGNGYTTFGPTDVNGVTTITVDTITGSRLELREVLQNGYIPFTFDQTHQSNSDKVSAEFYCYNDVLNYDNWDYINSPQWGNTYYCVGFNVLIEEPIEGCTDPEATNYNPEATVDDGSCEYDVYGCTDPEANNYDPEATVDDGSCTYPPGPVYGCTDPEATNYNQYATVDDGSCEYDVLGCTDPEALNFNPEATVDDGSCTYPEKPVYGCTDPVAYNYNPGATADDGSCTYGGGSRSGGYAGPVGEVLGEEIVEPCGLYLYEYIQYGASNNPEEVKKLQIFLNDYMGSNLSITGIYDLATMNVLNQFQVQCKEQVLQPWVDDAGTHCDVNEPTGYVYKTTQRWINLIMCPELNLPMPDLSSYYPKADCAAYWGETAVLGEEVVVDGEPSEETTSTEGEEPEVTEEPEETPEGVGGPEAFETEVFGETGGEGIGWGMWILIIVLAVIIILALYFLLKKPKQS